MVSRFVENVLSRAEKFEKIYEILGISREDYDKLFSRYGEEFQRILRLRSFIRAGIGLLRWLGFKDEEIDLERIVKAVVVMKVLVHYLNKRRG